MDLLLRPFKGAKVTSNTKVKSIRQFRKFFVQVPPEEWIYLQFDTKLRMLFATSTFLANFSAEQKLAYATAIEAALRNSGANQLKEISFPNCQLGDIVTTKLLESIHHCKFLTILELQGNMVASESIICLARVHKNNRLALQQINLSQNQITAAPLQKVAQIINTSLCDNFRIELEGNNVSAEEIKQFKQFLQDTKIKPISSSSSPSSLSPSSPSCKTSTTATASPTTTNYAVTSVKKVPTVKAPPPLLTTAPCLDYRKPYVATCSDDVSSFLQQLDSSQWNNKIRLDEDIKAIELQHNYGDSNLDDHDVKQIVLGLMKSSELYHVSFSSNRIGDEGAKEIAELWSSHYFIETLDLNDNKIGDSGGKAILYKISHRNRCIKRVDLSGNYIRNSYLEGVVQELATDYPHISVDISNNPIGTPTTTAKTATTATTSTTAITPSTNQIKATHNASTSAKAASATSVTSSAPTAMQRRQSNLEMFNSTKSGNKYESNAPELAKAVQELMNITCISKFIGKGRDNFGSTHTGYRVVRVLRVNNEDLLEDYEFECKKISKKWREQSIAQLTIQTTSVVQQFQQFGQVNSLLNEGYFFHGTKPTLAEIIVSQGFDNRVASPHGLFGAGLYFAENSSKSDEYVVEDSHGFCHMFLCKVILGAAKIQLKGVKYNRPPCVNCCASLCNHVRLDSVVGEVKKNNPSAYLAKYREYIVYEKRQVLPVFHIVYKRI